MPKVNFNPISNDRKKAAVSELNPLLVDSIDLYNQIKLAHWNLRDPDFIAVHRLFDEVGAAVLEGVDLIAERIRQLGEPVVASTAVVSKQSSLKGFPTGVIAGQTAIKAVCEAVGHCVEMLHQSIVRMDEAGDPITADLLTQVSRGLEVQLWFLESHLS
ncbi:MAG: DNA starvation/stationary phase protection protein Dps [Fimbriimonadaceae bacterium]|nr:DNA starvation/stationary phase protection protein Dps [Fimbriimonadaceae bacterium]